MSSPTSTIEIFQNHPEQLVFKAEQVIFSEGEPSNFMYGIIEGEVELMTNGQTFERIGPGEVFGTAALLEEQPRPYTAIAKKDCQLATLDEQHFLFAAQELPTFALEVIKSYLTRLERLLGLEVLSS
jgi:CRP/FNR family transcriptional regulator, cyclic AMP receptor protein